MSYVDHVSCSEGGDGLPAGGAWEEQLQVSTKFYAHSGWTGIQNYLHRSQAEAHPLYRVSVGGALPEACRVSAAHHRSY